MSTAVATATPVAQFSSFMDRFKPQMALALPKHMNADRMARLAVTAFSSNHTLQECTPQSIAGSVLTAAQLGLEIGINGHAFLVPYNSKENGQWVKKAQLIPGWKGLVDLVSRTGRAAAWTGAVFDGDQFDYELGDRPFVKHRPAGEDDPARLLYVYAIGRVNKSEWPIIEVWSMTKVWRHRDRLIEKLSDAQKAKHYSFRDPEMYARKVPLLQVVKYLPSSPELSAAVAAAEAADRGAGITIDGDFVVTTHEEDESPQAQGQQEQSGPQPLTPESFDKQKATWQTLVETGKKSPNDLIAFIQTKHLLTDDQKVEIASWGVKKGEPS